MEDIRTPKSFLTLLLWYEIMQFIRCLLIAFLFAFGFLSVSGCTGGSSKAEVAPRTEAEIEAYKQQTYAAEEEDDQAAAEDEE